MNSLHDSDTLRMGAMAFVFSEALGGRKIRVTWPP